MVCGSSQSSIVASIEKRNLTNASDTVKSQLQFVLTGNPDRSNGVVLERFAPLSIPFLGFTANGATPTDTGIATTDISFQYDIAADPANRQTYGDTTYITIPTKHLPAGPAAVRLRNHNGHNRTDHTVVDLIEPTLRVLVELGYDRSIDYGTPAPARLLPKIEPVKLGADSAEHTKSVYSEPHRITTHHAGPPAD